MRVLFICSRNRWRSPTAETVFASVAGVETASAGTSADAEQVVSADLIEWAEVIFAMEGVHRRRLQRMFPALMRHRRVIVLGIPDEYGYLDGALVARLKAGVLPYLVKR